MNACVLPVVCLLHNNTEWYLMVCLMNKLIYLSVLLGCSAKRVQNVLINAHHFSCFSFIDLC